MDDDIRESDVMTDDERARCDAMERVVKLAAKIGWPEVERLVLRQEVYANATDTIARLYNRANVLDSEMNECLICDHCALIREKRPRGHDIDLYADGDSCPRCALGLLRTASLTISEGARDE